MTDKATVRAKYPQAMQWHWADGWVIYSKPSGGEHLTSTGHRSRAAAWREAAKRLASQSDADSKP